LWSAWDGNSPLSDVLALDATESRSEADRLAETSGDLSNKPNIEVPGVQVPGAPQGWAWSIAPPDHEARTEVKTSERALARGRDQLE
jgi:hypothetical protein